MAIATNKRSQSLSASATVASFTLFAIAVDQSSKWLILNQVMVPPQVIPITPFFNLALGFNTGVSFGIGRDFFNAYPIVLALFKVTVACGLILWAVLTESRLERVGLSFIAGGALGNAIDRWLQGAVTDFLDAHWNGWHWPTFNIADVAICTGVALILLAAILPTKSVTDAASE